MSTALDRASDRRLDAAARQRTVANHEFFTEEAERLARLCHLMAERFARGGRLVAFGRSPAARSDARHVAVEFVHPVIVGKRALPAIGLAGEGGDRRSPGRPDRTPGRHRDRVWGRPRRRRGRPGAWRLARGRGCLTIAFCDAGAEWEFDPPSADPAVRQELVETLYHLLWELVHVFFDHRGLLEGRDTRRVHDAGASSFLYPFLDERERELEPVVDDVRRSVLMKSEEIGLLRTQTLTDNHDVLAAAAAALRASFDRGGKLLALRQRRIGHRRDGRRRRLPLVGGLRPGMARRSI